MMKYLLLKPFLDEKNLDYKGIMRHGPPFPSEESEQILWLKYAKQVDDLGFLPTFQAAYSLYEEYNLKGEKFDLVGCIDVSTQDIINDNNNIPYPLEFLGFDICDKNFYSVLNEFGYTSDGHHYIDNLKEETFRNLSLLYFSKRINKKKLLETYSDAISLIDAEKKIIALYPQLNVIHISTFYVYKMYNISIEKD